MLLLLLLQELKMLLKELLKKEDLKLKKNSKTLQRASEKKLEDIEYANNA